MEDPMETTTKTGGEGMFVEKAIDWADRWWLTRVLIYVLSFIFVIATLAPTIPTSCTQERWKRTVVFYATMATACILFVLFLLAVRQYT